MLHIIISARISLSLSKRADLHKKLFLPQTCKLLTVSKYHKLIVLSDLPRESAIIVGRGDYYFENLNGIHHEKGNHTYITRAIPDNLPNIFPVVLFYLPIQCRWSCATLNSGSEQAQ